MFKAGNFLSKKKKKEGQKKTKMKKREREINVINIKIEGKDWQKNKRHRKTDR